SQTKFILEILNAANIRTKSGKKNIEAYNQKVLQANDAFQQNMTLVRYRSGPRMLLRVERRRFRPTAARRWSSSPMDALGSLSHNNIANRHDRGTGDGALRAI